MIDESARIHPTALVDEPACIGARTCVWHFSHVMAGARIGADCVLGQNAFVAGSVRIGDGCRIQNNVSLYDGVVLEEGVFVGPSVVFTNVSRPRAGFPRRDRYETTLIGQDATLGANSTIRSGITIGRGAFVAAAAMVTASVPPFVLVTGVPARPAGWVCLCGERPGDDLVCGACGRRYRLLGGGLEELAREGGS